MQLLACDVSDGGRPRSSMMSPGSLPRPRGALRGWDRAPGRGSILGPKPEPPSRRLCPGPTVGSPPRQPGKVSAARATAVIAARQAVRAAPGKVFLRRGT